MATDTLEKRLRAPNRVGAFGVFFFSRVGVTDGKDLAAATCKQPPAGAGPTPAPLHLLSLSHTHNCNLQPMVYN